MLLGLLTANLLIGLGQQLALARAGTNIVEQARERMVTTLLRARVGEVTRRPRGELVGRVVGDPPLLREGTGGAVVGALTAVVSIVGAVILMALLDRVLLGVAVGVITVVGLVIALVQRPASIATERTQAAVAELGAGLEGVLGSLRTVKTNNAEQRSIDRITDQARLATRHSFRAVLATSAGQSVASAGIQVSILIVLGIGVWRVSTQAMSIASLLAFLLYLVLLVPPVSELARHSAGLQSGVAAARRIEEVLAVPPERLGGQPAPIGAVVLSSVEFGYADAQTASVDRVTIGLPARGHCALVGPSGAGKTTLLALLLGLVEPQHGSVSIGGADYSGLSLASIRTLVGYVEQAAPLVPGTIRDNLTVRHPDASESELWAALASVHLAERISLLPQGLNAGANAEQLSGGERQRIALARVLIRPPAVLILDEATAQLDALTERAIATVVERLAHTGVVITVAHRLSTVVDAKMIMVMDAGQIVATGSHAELLVTCGLYADLISALRIAVPGTQRQAA